MEHTNLFSIYTFDMFNPDLKAPTEKITLVSGTNYIPQDSKEQQQVQLPVNSLAYSHNSKCGL